MYLRQSHYNYLFPVYKGKRIFFFLTRNKTKQLIPALYFHNIYTHTYDIQVDYTLHIFTVYTQNNTMAVLRYWYVVLKITQWHFKDQTVYLQIQTLLLPNGLTFRDYCS